MIRNFTSDIIICGIIILSCLVIHFFSDILRIGLGGSTYTSDLTISQIIENFDKEYGWIIKLIFNCFGYSCVLVPGYLIYKYTKYTNYLEKYENGCIYGLVRMYILGNTRAEIDRSDSSQLFPYATTATKIKRSSSQDAVLLVYCFAGLMGSYLTWGVLQEKIITQRYEDSDGIKSHFKDSQFLVFANRLLAFIISGGYLLLKRKERYQTPLYKYSFASFSNIMSAWFQYEALKFVSFPTQVLAKSCKIIPVMLMGRVISRNKYETYEYMTAGLISFGMIFFMTGSTDGSKTPSVTTLTGIFLLTMYMIFDSFTANWQGELFKSYSMSSIQMMWGVNLFSTIFTAASLSVQGGFMDSLEFATEHPKFIFDCMILSVSSAAGQLFIFYTISLYGPIVFTIIMTLRQAAAIILSCLIYQHNISILGLIGVLIVFSAIFVRVFYNQRIKLRKRLDSNRSKLAV